MTQLTRRSALSAFAAAAAAAPLRTAAAQAYPSRPISLLVPWAPGGSTDILARIVAAHLHQSMGQPVIIENRTGAAGNIGTGAVARAAPDGYTILFNTMSVHTMNHALFAAMPFDGVKDFSPITLLAHVTNTMVVHPSVPANTVAEFIAHAKANPGKIAYASSGPGSTNHLCAAMLEKMTGIEMLHVPDGRRDRAGLRDDGVVRLLRPARNAEGHRDEAQRRDRPRAVPARGEEAHGRHRGRGRCFDAGGARRDDAARCREMGRADQEHRDRHAMSVLRMIFSENRYPSSIGVEDMLFGIMR
jgi:hypothetical protein